MDVIKTEKLTKYYLGHKVLGVKDLDLDIHEGEIFGFIGPNGAGKSTTIRLLLDFIRPSSGSGKIFGLDINKDSVKIKADIGYLPGEIFLSENMTGKTCLDYYAGFKGKVDRKYIDKLIKRFELDLGKKVRDYSKGNKQKLAIILAFLHKPKLLILDEPTSGLDPLNQQEFYTTIQEAKARGAATFFSTHILQEAESICDRVGIIKEGKLLKIENVDEFRQKNVRILSLETKEVIPLSDLKVEGVSKIQRTTNGYDLTIVGPNAEIMRKLLKNKIDDIKIATPSLEEIFMHYYE